MAQSKANDSKGKKANRPISFVKVTTQYENVGDCLINRELLRLLAERSDVYLDTKNCPVEFANQLHSVLEHSGQNHKILRGSFYASMLSARLTQRDCFWFLMPGGITGNGKTGSSIKTWATDLPLRINHALGVKICQVGASFGNMSQQHLNLWRQRRKFFSVFSPRDSLSAEYLTKHGILCDPCIPDLAFNIFQDSPSNHADQALPSTINEQQQIGCFSFRTDQAPEQEAYVRSEMQNLCERFGPHIRWKPIAQVRRDLPGMLSLCNHLLQSKFNVESVMDIHHDIEKCLAFYRTVNFVVSNRLHVLLMAASQGARILALTGANSVDRSSGAKLKGLLKDLGLEHAILDQDIANLSNFSAHNNPGFVVPASQQRFRLLQAFDALFHVPSSDLNNDSITKSNT